ncbi:hypothetical protein KM92DES2_11031 [uncultured Desulfovibrio sp.]|uniref:Uncharacterized protein n=1 Tax=uncultured Desulfovibrio sp. TaxID=167968 RepID=A0A212JFN4_9BACT|nr:hypothetical protein KM92DES2_11031 [uncultured Desulfovibrio sp.]
MALGASLEIMLVICSTRVSGFCPRPTMNPIKNDQPTATTRIAPSRASIGPERRITKRRFSPEGWETTDLRGLRKGAAIHYPPSCGNLWGPGLTVKAHPVRGRQSTRKASFKTRLNGYRHRADLSHAEYSTFMKQRR